jgi:hypothetical protein
MVLLVQIAKRDRVRQELIQVLYRLTTGGLGQRDRQFDQVSVGLDFVGALTSERPRPIQNDVRINGFAAC